MRKSIFSLAIGLLALFTVGASASMADDGCIPFGPDGKLEVDIALDTVCNIHVKASTDLLNACLEGPFFISIDNAIIAHTVGVFVAGDGGSCSLLTDVDDEGNAQAKGSCKNNGNTKIEITVTSCSIGPV